MDLKTLSSQIRTCTNCDLHKTRKKVVIGRGLPNPDVVLIGEAPGSEEDESGKPFVGRSGKLLDEAIVKNGIENFAIINILKCRPPGNRKPEPDEIEACRPWLNQQLDLLNPKLIILVGATALTAFFPDLKITKTVNELSDANLDNLDKKLLEKDGRKYYAVYHPSYVLRDLTKKPEYIKSFGAIRFFLDSIQGRKGVEAKTDEPDMEPLIPRGGFRPVPPEFAKPLDQPKTQKYALLHVHTEHGSIGDVFRTDKELAEDLSNKGFKACAITDHGSLSGLYYTQEALKEKGIKPILGLECYINEGPREQSHLILLVKNKTGYKNLLKLHNLAKNHTHKVFSRTIQKIPFDKVLEHSEGLICCSACISGTLARRWKREENYEEVVEKLKTAFGEDFYLEAMPNRLEEQVRFNQILMGLASKHNLKMIVTTDSHYNSPEDKKYHDILKAISYKKTINDKIGFGDDTFCNLTTEQIESLLKENHPTVYPIREELFANTLEVAAKCNFELSGHLGDTLIGSDEEARENILNRMDIEKYKKESGHDPEIVDKRIKTELDLIFGRGYAKYFDVVLQMISYADQSGIPRGPGRGSVGGSLVAYLLGITQVDPLRFGTLFERFLSPTRFPDIDMDFSGKNREAIIGYLKAKHGRDNVSYIVTFSEFGDKGVLRDVGRVYNVPLEEINRVTKELSTKTAESIKIEDALEASQVVKDFQRKYPEVIDCSIRLRGKVRHTGMHASGTVVCKDLVETIPTELMQYGDESYVVSSWEKDALEKIGIIKFDILGLNVLDIIDGALKNIGISWDDLPQDYSDKEVFEFLKAGKTSGVFQFGSQLITDYLRHLNPNNFNDLVATNALCRPGPLNSGMAMDYVRRKNGEEWEAGSALLEPITKDTFGIICYQEQIMKVANQLGNFSMVESEKFLKLVSKSKGKEAIQEKYNQFLQGAISNGLTSQFVEELFNKIIEFGRYSFNLSHSVEYSILGYWTAWLKLKHPLQTYVSYINLEGDEDEVLRSLKEAIDSGITLKPPSISRPSAEATFDLESKTIYLGLNKIKGIGPAEMKNILESGSNFVKLKNSVKKNVFKILIEVGYLDSLESCRRFLYEGKELPRNTLFNWAEKDSVVKEDWPEAEKMSRMRKYLSWPRSADELPKTEWDDYRKPLSCLKEPYVDNCAFLSVGWVYDFKIYNNKSGNTYILKYEDGTSRVELNLSNHLYRKYKNIVDEIVEGKFKEPLMFAVHPYYLTRGQPQLREGKAQILWVMKLDGSVPSNIISGIERDIEISKGQYLITNISYGTSKAGNRYSSVESVDFNGNIKYGVIMDKEEFSLPNFGNIIRGSWNKDFFRRE